MERQDKDTRHQFYNSKVSLWTRIVVSAVGLILLIVGFIVPPQGVIDRSVLIAFGEIALFVAALMWIDYHYAFRGKKYTKHK